MLKGIYCSLVILAGALGPSLRAADPGEPANTQPMAAGLHGVTRAPGGPPLTSVKIVVHSVDEDTDHLAVSGDNGTFYVDNLKPGRYQLTANQAGFETSPVTTVELAAQQSLNVEITLGPTVSSSCPACQMGFFQRLGRAYRQDWKGPTESGPDSPFRGYPAPMSNPPWPFTVWPYGGSVVIGQPNSSSTPLMQALYAGPHGKAWQDSRIQFYGWVNTGFNISSSNKPGFANAPAAYNQLPNSIQLDQATLYIERVPDSVQKEHFDWGFRLTSLYGLDYRFTTSKGILSNQLLGKNQKYGFDPVMAYVDLYFPKVADGLNVRIGRYISLPDIEAQLAPNNYTYSHSLTYTYDCYTQDGINGTLKIGNHWMVQLGLSAGCDAAPWTPDAKVTGNACLSYTWRNGQDNIYTCANSINDGKYAYNNLAAYYATWYHKINSSWHIATESWYQYERKTPSIFGNVPAQTNASGAWCAPGEDRCFAPEWALLNYVEKQFSKKDYLSIRNEYFDDIKGQRTGTKSRYTEHLIGWGHWIGTTILVRPEVSFGRSYDNPAYDNGTKKNQLMFAGDVIWFY
jgi:hypothetical protein